MADTTLRSGQGVAVSSDQVVEGNFYASSDVLTISGSLNRDGVLAAYRSVTLNGTVGEDLSVAAGEVRLFGSVGEDVRIIAGEITVADTIAGDLLVLGGSLEVLSTATIEGDILFYGGNAEISGTVNGTIIGRMQSLRVDGVVGGGVSVRTDSLTLGERAAVTGNVRYTSESDVLRAANASVAGEITRLDPVVTGTTVTLEFVLIPFLISLFTILVWHLLFRRSLDHLIIVSQANYARSFLVGFLVVAFGPPVVVVVMVTVIGSLAGFLLFALWLAMILVGIIVAPAILGRFIQQTITPATAIHPVLLLVIGTLFLHMLRFVPLFGVVAIIAILLIAIGSVTRELFLLLRGAPKLEEIK